MLELRNSCTDLYLFMFYQTFCDFEKFYRSFWLIFNSLPYANPNEIPTTKFSPNSSESSAEQCAVCSEESNAVCSVRAAWRSASCCRPAPRAPLPRSVTRRPGRSAHGTTPGALTGLNINMRLFGHRMAQFFLLKKWRIKDKKIAREKKLRESKVKLTSVDQRLPGEWICKRQARKHIFYVFTLPVGRQDIITREGKVIMQQECAKSKCFIWTGWKLCRSRHQLRAAKPLVRTERDQSSHQPKTSPNILTN